MIKSFRKLLNIALATFENWLSSMNLKRNPSKFELIYSDRVATRNDGQLSNAFVCEHLATFVIPKGEVMSAKDGIRKLQEMNTLGGVWTMKVILKITPGDIIVLDDANGEEMEKFSLSSLKNLEYLQKTQGGQIYNNVVAFSVSDSDIPELHMFQCLGRSGQEFVASVEAMSKNQTSLRSVVLREKQFPVADADRLTSIAQLGFKNESGKEMLKKSIRYKNLSQNNDAIKEPADRQIKLLDCLFTDIEAFVNQVQQGTEAFENLKKRQTVRQNGNGDGLLLMRCRLPPPRDFVDILQKFKLAFILIAKLRKVITNPNAPELVHFLFKPLAFVVKAAAGPQLEKMELAQSVSNPLINDEVKIMFENCLDTPENELWKKLGPAWNTISSEWSQRLPLYMPIFQDGWAPPMEWMDEIIETDQSSSSVPTGRNVTNEEFASTIKKKKGIRALAKDNRPAKNPKEISISAGDVLEVLDDSKNWWKVKNRKGETGYAPKGIVEKF